MGIPTDPDDWEYGDNSGCFTPGHTPKKLYASVSGIKTGAAWVLAQGQPRNGVHTLTKLVGQSYWFSPGPPNPDDYQTYIPGSRLRIAAAIGFCFGGTSPANCKFYFENGEQDPAGGFYGGQAIIFQKEPATGDAASLADISALLGMDGRESRMSEAFPLDNDELVAMFADLVESTRIRIKYDFS